MAEKTQSFSSHTRWNVMYHFIVSPLALLNVYAQFRHAYHASDRFSWWNAIFSIALLLFVLVARTMVLTVQDRLIRLEERLRLAQVLPEDLRPRVPELTVTQLVGLRFASDAEVADRMREALQEKLDGEAIKKRIQTWRSDEFRV